MARVARVGSVRRIGAVPLGIAIGTMVAACFIKPDAPAVGDDAGAGSDAIIDGPLITIDGPIDALSAECSVEETFTGNGSDCGAWGSNTGTGSQTVMWAGDNLVMDSATGDGVSSCVSKASNHPFGSVTVQIVQFVSMPNGRTGIELTFNGTNQDMVTLAFTSNNPPTSAEGELIVGVSTQQVFANQGNFWRFSRDGTGMSLYRSVNGSDWIFVAKPPVSSLPTTVSVRLFADYADGFGSQSAKFDYLSVCAVP